MKFWAQLDEKNLNRPGRFVFQQAPSISNSPEDIGQVERDAAYADTNNALADLQQRLETGNINVPDSERIASSDIEASTEIIPPSIDEEIVILVRISRNNQLWDDNSADDRNFAEWARDKAGQAVDGAVATSLSEGLQWATDLDSEAYILNLISPEAKSRFLSDYRGEAMNLFTDQTAAGNGTASYRANFFGDKDLIRQSSFTELLEPSADHQFLQIGDISYARTEYGYIAFSPFGKIGERATITSATEFTVLNHTALDAQPALVESLSTAKKTSSLFENIKDTELMAELEFNRNTNFYTAQTWKNFAGNVSSIDLPSDLPFANTVKELFADGGTFKHFLDGDRSLKNLSNDTALPFTIPGFPSPNPAITLKASSTAAVFRKGIMAALNLVQNFVETESEKYQAAIKAEKDPKVQAQMGQKLEQLASQIPEFFNKIESVVAESQAENKSILDGNEALFLREFENLSPEELNQWLAEFDNGIRELRESENMSTQAVEQKMGTLLVRILGTNKVPGSQLLRNNPHIRTLLLSRVNSLSREPGTNDMAALMEIGREQFYVKSSVQRLQAIDSNFMPDLDLENISIEDIDAIITRAQTLHESLRIRKVNDDALSPQDLNLLNELGLAIPHLKSRKMAINKALKESATAQDQEANSRKIVTIATESLAPPNAGNGDFYKSVDIGATYRQTYSRQNNGESPPFSEDHFQFISQQVAAGVPVDQITLAISPHFQSASPDEQVSYIYNLERIPAQTNLVGLTPEGSYIIESTGTDQTRFIQSPGDGKIIAEHLLRVPDSEDLRVPPTEWATAQFLGACQDSFVVKSSAELAQAGEKLGNRGLVNYFKQHWGIRGNNTLPESELDKAKCLGGMMSDNHINLHTVLSQLNAVKWDDTADGSRAVDVRLQFNEVLEAAAAGNNKGFRALLNLDNLPPEEVNAYV